MSGGLISGAERGFATAQQARQDRPYANETISKESPVQGELNRMGESLAVLHKQLSELRDRIAPLLDVHPEKAGGTTAEEAPRGAFCAALRNINGGIGEASNVVDSLLRDLTL